MADRYSYLPSVGFFIMVAWGVGGLVGQSRYRKIGMGVLMGLTLTVLLLCTRMQVRHWQNDFTLFGHAIEVTKRNPLMYNYYGDALLEEGRIEEASQKFHEALRISPNHPLTHYNLGRVMAQKGNYDEAIEHLKKALQAQPGWPQASNLLREIQEKTKQPE
jgi:tetratricopeptide (TPR) repeat protein